MRSAPILVALLLVGIAAPAAATWDVCPYAVHVSGCVGERQSGDPECEENGSTGYRDTRMHVGGVPFAGVGAGAGRSCSRDANGVESHQLGMGAGAAVGSVNWIERANGDHTRCTLEATVLGLRLHRDVPACPVDAGWGTFTAWLP